jgi:hypothetical protein
VERVIFCPDESLFEDAEKLARSWILPIQNGHSSRTKIMDFDDSQVSLLSIPIEKYVDYNPEIGINELFVFIFVDDFESCKKVQFRLVEVDKDDYVVRVIGDMAPEIIEEHRVVVKHRFLRTGRYIVVVTLNGTEICKNEVTVHNTQRR